MDEKENGNSVSLKRLEANRRNAQLSTGPRTEEGKARSRRNSLKHGVLASALLITEGEGAEDAVEFEELLCSLREDLNPVGAVEGMLVERMAVCCWRQKRALRCEAALVRRAYADPLEFDVSDELASTRDHLSLPLGENLDRILRYETTIQRQLTYAINPLERLQRARKGEHVAAPLSVQLLSDQ
jgi:hypothetical protein